MTGHSSIKRLAIDRIDIFSGPKIARLAAMRHADIAFKHLRPRQPAQALTDLREVSNAVGQ